MSPTELHAFQLARAQELINSAPADIEHVGSALDGNGQAVVEIDELEHHDVCACWQNSSGLIAK